VAGSKQRSSINKGSVMRRLKAKRGLLLEGRLEKKDPRETSRRDSDDVCF